MLVGITPSVSEPISVYPNPTTGLLTFKMDKHLGKEIAVSIYSIDGKLMINKHQTAQSENSINGETLHEGLYILQIKVGDAAMMGKFLVQK
jgi:Secretion system C-terminal sorting domain